MNTSTDYKMTFHYVKSINYVNLRLEENLKSEISALK